MAFSAGEAGTRRLFGSCRSAQSAPTTAGDLGAVPVAADDQPLHGLVAGSSPSGGTAAGSSSRISSAKDSLRPLCGVAEARISASVCRASSRASWLFCVAVLVTLCDSSITTASHRCLRRLATYWSDFSVSIEMITRL